MNRYVSKLLLHLSTFVLLSMTILTAQAAAQGRIGRRLHGLHGG